MSKVKISQNAQLYEVDIRSEDFQEGNLRPFMMQSRRFNDAE